MRSIRIAQVIIIDNFEFCNNFVHCSLRRSNPDILPYRSPVCLDNPDALTIYYHSLNGVDDSSLLKGGSIDEDKLSAHPAGFGAGDLSFQPCLGSRRD